MKFCKNNLKLSTITLILVLAISATLVALPAATAQEGTTWQIWAVCEVIPNKVGVNQPVLIALGTTRQTAWPQSGWYGLTVTVTKPDGHTDTLGPYNTDTTGLTGASYTPTQVGTYTFQVHFPQQDIEVTAAGAQAGTTMLAADSAEVELTVTEAPLEYFPDTPLPNEYWTRPIDAQSRQWYTVAGSWLDGSFMRSVNNRNAPFNDGPETAHILWTKPLNIGGLVGGDMGWYSYESGDAYEGKWQNPVIISGILFSNRYTLGKQTTFATNLRTGEELWSTTLGEDFGLSLSSSFGQTMYWDTMNMHGAFSYLWATSGSTWYAFNPTTGRWDYTITNVPGGSRVFGPKGEILIYSLSTGSMSMWNSTRCVYETMKDWYPTSSNVAYEAGRWRPMGREFNGTRGIEWTKSIPTNLAATLMFGRPSYGKVVIPGDRIIGGNTEWAGGAPVQNPEYWAINIKPGHEGEVIFNKAWTLPEQGLHVDFAGSHPYSVEYDVFVVTAKETRKHYGISMTTGNQLWETTWFEPYMNSFANIYMDPWGQEVCADGKLITAGFGGVVNAYSLVDGSHIWEYKIDDYYSEFLFSNDWSAPTGFITDGKVYLFHQEHSVINPMPRGAPAVCLDLNTGEEIWRADGLRFGTRWGGQPIIGDSVIAAFGSYDNTINALGKGPSELTVSAPDTAIPLGNKALVKGSVMDVSPGTMYYEQAARFPNGVPAISDADMSEWMLYVYKDRPMPADATGVEVVLMAIDPNGQYKDLGRTTSDMYGNYGLAFKPETEGTYMVIATFEGSGAYYGSTSTTYITVGPASTPSTPIEPEQPAFITTELAIILAVVAIAAIGVVGFWVLRKRK